MKRSAADNQRENPVSERWWSLLVLPLLRQLLLLLMLMLLLLLLLPLLLLLLLPLLLQFCPASAFAFAQFSREGCCGIVQGGGRHVSSEISEADIAHRTPASVLGKDSFAFRSHLQLFQLGQKASSVTSRSPNQHF